MFTLNKNNRIVYPSAFQINYKNHSKFNTNVINNKFYRNIEKTKVFHMESMNICELEAWNNCFKLIDIPYDKKKFESINDYLKSEDFRSMESKEKRKILKKGKIMMDYEHFGGICCDIQKVFSGTFNYVGENFSKIPLVVGSLQTYIYQYISDSVFGYPNVYAAIQNMPDINNMIDSLPKKLISNLKQPNVLECFYHDFVEQIISETEKKEAHSRNFLFRKKSVIEFSLFLKSPNINFDSSDALKEYLTTEIVEMDISDSLWKIYFILN